MVWVQPVYDRTQADVVSRAPKAYYSANDLNRIEGNLQYLSSVLTAYEYQVPFVAKTDWANNDLPRRGDIERWKEAVDAIHAVFVRWDSDADIDRKDWVMANAIEGMMAETKTLITLMESSFRRCGTFAAGEVFNFTQLGGV